jgi:hypothetical protein
MKQLPDPKMAVSWLQWAQRLFVWLKELIKRLDWVTPSEWIATEPITGTVHFDGSCIEYRIAAGLCHFVAFIQITPAGGEDNAILAQIPAADFKGRTDAAYEFYGHLFYQAGGVQAISNPLIKLSIYETAPDELAIWHVGFDGGPKLNYIITGFYKVA